MALHNRVLIYGHNGGLGKALTQLFRKNQWHVIGCDITKNEVANVSLTPTKMQSTAEQGADILDQLKNVLPSGSSLNAILCASGGFAAGNSADANFLESSDNMISSSIHASLICSKIAAAYLKSPGLLALPGAAAAFHPTPGLLGYGAAKAYVHFLVKSLAASGSGIPEGCKVIGIAPHTLDTPGNRAAMPDSNRQSWTSLDELSSKLLLWATYPEQVENAAIYEIITSAGITSYEKAYI